MALRPGFVNRGLSAARYRGKALTMGKDAAPSSREERLAAKLRENLHRRKAQARAVDRGDKPTLPKQPAES